MCKKKIISFITSISLLAVFASTAIGQGVLQQDTRHYVSNRRYMFQSGTTIKFHRDGQVHIGTIKYDYSFYVGTKKVRFLNKTPMRFYPNGHVESGTIKYRSKFKAGKKEVYFRKRRVMNFLNNGRAISGTLYKDEVFATGNNKMISCLKDTEVKFHPKKNYLISAYIKENLTINGAIQNFTIKGKTKVLFWKNGVIRSAIMAKDASIPRENGGKTKVKKGDRVTFYRNGNIEE